MDNNKPDVLEGEKVKEEVKTVEKVATPVVEQPQPTESMTPAVEPVKPQPQEIKVEVIPPEDLKQVNEEKPEKVVEAEPITEKEVLPEIHVICPKCGEMITEEFYKKYKEQEAEEKNKELVDEKKGYTVRSEETGDKVYMVKDGVRYWVRNVDTLTKLGFHLGSERTIPFAELYKYPEGEPVDLTVPGAKMPEPPKELTPEEKKAQADNLESHKIWS